MIDNILVELMANKLSLEYFKVAAIQDSDMPEEFPSTGERLSYYKGFKDAMNFVINKIDKLKGI